MASHLDLEEQEQLAQLKHFWNKYGNPITWVLILVLGGYAAWNGWNYWNGRKAAEASALFGELERVSQAADVPRVQRAFDDLRKDYGKTTYALQGALVAARVLQDAGQQEPARAALQWAVEQSTDAGYQAVARLRLAGLLADAKSYEEALKVLSTGIPRDFEALAADRRGDILQLQGKKAEARAAYEKALPGLDLRTDYRRLVEVKLAALGGDPKSVTGAVKP